VLARQPRPEELTRLVQLYQDSLAEFTADAAAAKAMATEPLGPLPANFLARYDGDAARATAELAAWTVVGNVLLNLDETFMCP
jgi:hypothetical protein